MLRKILSELSFLLLLSSTVGCNLSDYIETLPGGYKYAFEGACANILYSNSKHVPSYYYLTNMAYNDKYICFTNVDSTVCMNAKYSEKEKDLVIEEKDKRYYIIEIKKDTVFGPLKQTEFYQVLKQKKIPKELSLTKEYQENFPM